MDLIPAAILGISVILLGQALFSLYLMLYAWEYPERLEASRGPREYLPPKTSFTVLLPARHEEAVIYDTIRRIWNANYPKRLLEIIVVCHDDDYGTIAEAERAERDIARVAVKVRSFADGPISKPHGLNVGLASATKKVVTIFDAEDDVDPDIFNVVNTVMLREGTGIVQAGVQLMNFTDHWFSIHNCLEYFFWFKSRLHFHAKVGMIPLGGNTVFIRRKLINAVGGWDEQCLTEDADIGLRLSALGEPIRVVYDAQHVTREETPDSLGSLIRQRTRWSQGFLQVLRKGTWLELPRLSQRLLAVYTLSAPVLQVLLMLLWPVAVFGGLVLRVPVPVAMVAFLPLYAVVFQFLVTLVGAFVFTREYGLAMPRSMPFNLALTFLPYQWVLGASSMRAMYRELEVNTGWEKTTHVGAHRRPGPVTAPRAATGRLALPLRELRVFVGIALDFLRDVAMPFALRAIGLALRAVLILLIALSSAVLLVLVGAIAAARSLAGGWLQRRRATVSGPVPPEPIREPSMLARTLRATILPADEQLLYLDSPRAARERRLQRQALVSHEPEAPHDPIPQTPRRPSFWRIRLRRAMVYGVVGLLLALTLLLAEPLAVKNDFSSGSGGASTDSGRVTVIDR